MAARLSPSPVAAGHGAAPAAGAAGVSNPVAFLVADVAGAESVGAQGS